MISSKPVSGLLPRRRLFRGEDPAAVLFEQWGACKDMDVTYSGNDTWDRMLQQGIQLLERFAQDGGLRIHRPRSSQQIQFNRTLAPGSNRRGGAARRPAHSGCSEREVSAQFLPDRAITLATVPGYTVWKADASGNLTSIATPGLSATSLKNVPKLVGSGN